MPEVRTLRRLTALLLLLVILGWSLAGQEEAGPTLLIRFSAEGGAAEAFSRELADALELTLRLAGVPALQRADFLLPERSLPAAEEYFRRVDAAAAVYGRVESGDSGGFLVHTSMWTPEAERVLSQSLEVEPRSVAAEGAEELALEIAGHVLGRDLLFGRVFVENADGLEDYAIYVDGQLIARNRARVRVPEGAYQVAVTAPGPLGDQPIARFEVEVAPEGVTTLALETVEDAPPDAARQEPAAPRAAGEPEATPEGPVERGSLRVGSAPDGATVILDGQVLGTTPLEAFGVEARRYELLVRKDLFRDAVAAVDVAADETTEFTVPLSVHAEAPVLAARLIAPAEPSVAGLSTFLLKIGYTVGTILLSYEHFDSLIKAEGILPVLDYMAIGALHAGSLVALRDDGQGLVSGLALGAIALAPVAILTAQNFLPNDPAVQGRLENIVGASLLAVTAGLSLYDIAFTAAAAQRRNDELLATVSRTGTLPARPSADRRRLVFESGAGGVLRVGYVQEFFAGRGRLEGSIGSGILVAEEMTLTPLASLRAGFRPFARAAPGLQPEISVLGQVETNFSDVGYVFGPALGAVLSLERLEIFWRSNVVFPVCTERPGLISSVGVSL